MQVIQENTDTLTLKIRPWLLWLVGSAFALMGAFLSLVLWQKTVLECVRSPEEDGKCRLQQTTAFSQSITELRLSELLGASIGTIRKEGQTPNHVRLITSSGNIPFIPYYTLGYGDRQQIVDEIDTFLWDPQQISLLIQDDSRWFAIAFGGLFMITGLSISLIFGQETTCIFDRQDGSLVVEKKGIILHHQRNYPITAVSDIEVEESKGSKGNTYRLSLVLDEANSSQPSLHLPLSPYYSAGLSEKQQAAHQIRTFLKL